MNIVDSLKWRYAVKKFDTERELTKHQILTLKEAFNLTATSYGLQPLQLLVIKNKDVQKKLVAHSFNQPQVLEASHLLVICVPKTYNSKEVEKYFNRVQNTRNTTDAIIAPFKEFLISEIDKKSQEDLFLWNKNQAYIALGNLLTVCAVEKIDACPMEGFIAEKYDKVLALKNKNLTSVLVLPVGFRSDDCHMKDMPKVRKTLSESIIEIN
ncbi:NAD(P)H-dependent oxidoreductase [Polaribacter sp. WD7]|uniref:NAD(P)H-dependent oxidoreductase n=1 Tax=Polaribacter sp. WD7 TaxID=2269061 RepID=UPI000DF2B7F1|nr:NAD(P)H-dependent oxidoreductase [Polaribacter sp. WD7]RCS28136.1 NAD(P)H-dependent oxidoreductase [Polaribacter sp. WD7]